VGQRRGVAEFPADARGGLAGGVSRGIKKPRAPKGLLLTITEVKMHELISNRGPSGEIRTARRPRSAEVSGDDSRQALLRLTKAESA